MERTRKKRGEERVRERERKERIERVFVFDLRPPFVWQAR